MGDIDEDEAERTDDGDPRLREAAAVSDTGRDETEPDMADDGEVVVLIIVIILVIVVVLIMLIIMMTIAGIL